VLRGLGVEQRGILAVLASKPEQWWRRAHIPAVRLGRAKTGQRDATLFEAVKADEKRVLVARRQATGGGKFLAGSVLA
jgi:hypothetical protein